MLTESTPANGDRFKFAAREHDATTGLYYNRARYYDSATGRFLSRDPSGFAGGDSNLYRYLANSPVNGVDPTGEIAIVLPALPFVFQVLVEAVVYVGSAAAVGYASVTGWNMAKSEYDAYTAQQAARANALQVESTRLEIQGRLTQAGEQASALTKLIAKERARLQVLEQGSGGPGFENKDRWKEIIERVKAAIKKAEESRDRWRKTMDDLQDQLKNLPSVAIPAIPELQGVSVTHTTVINEPEQSDDIYNSGGYYRSMPGW